MDHDEVMQVLNGPLAQELMSSRIPARLAYTGRDGFPRAIPIGYLFTGSHLVMATDPGTHKVAALTADPHVALTIDTEAFPPKILLIRGVATIDVVEGIPEEYWQASRKYLADDEWDGFVEGVKQTYERMARITVEPTWARLIDFETTLPEHLEKKMREGATRPQS